MGQYSDKQLSHGNSWGVPLYRGDRLGCFNLGSSVVLIFEAPRNFQFKVSTGQKVYYGEPLGNFK